MGQNIKHNRMEGRGEMNGRERERERKKRRTRLGRGRGAEGRKQGREMKFSLCH